MKYKLLKDYPPFKKGDILEYYSLIQKYSTKAQWMYLSKEILDNYPNWFVSYMLTTEDGIDIYADEKYIVLTDEGFTYQTKISDIKYLHTDVKRFSTKEAAEKYLKKQSVKDLWKGVGPGIREQLGSDYDIDKTCETCKFSIRDYQPDPCKICSANFKNKWQPKESTLMLGNVPVKVIKGKKVSKKYASKSLIEFGGIFISFGDWLEWYDRYVNNPHYSLRGIIEYEGLLKDGKGSVYKTILHPQINKDNTIAHIHNVSWDQIYAINKKIKNYEFNNQTVKRNTK